MQMLVDCGTTKRRRLATMSSWTWEDLEEIVALRSHVNHNEAIVLGDEIQLDIEGFEEIVASGYARKHNETSLIDDDVELDLDTLEDVVAPGAEKIKW